jgi:hypothetical protein
MILFVDVISGDEMFSDAFKVTEVGSIAYEVDCSMITVRNGVDVDIGANASAEEAEEALEDGSQTINNVVYSFRLNPTSFDKKSYMTYIKGYMKAVKAKLSETKPDRVGPFEKEAAGFVKKILENFSNYDFYVGENMNPEGMVALLNYREDGITPYFTFFRDGLKEVKL